MADHVDRATRPWSERRRRRGSWWLALHSRTRRRGAARPRRPAPDAAAVPLRGRDPPGSYGTSPTGGRPIRAAPPSSFPASCRLAQKGMDDRRCAIPFGSLGGELTASRGGDRVEPRLPVVV